jgi:hypothetical protein
MTTAQRRLAAIVAADVAGYSRLMGRDESGTLARLKAHRTEGAGASYGGRLVKLMVHGTASDYLSDNRNRAFHRQVSASSANYRLP